MGADSIYCECGKEADLVGGDKVYPHRPDLARKLFYRCDGCGAYCATNEATALPIGRLANADGRAARQRAHAAFERLWRAKMRRDGCSERSAMLAGYRWLAGQLGIEPAACRIAALDIAACERVAQICGNIGERNVRT